jgi:multidrug efflux system outer membrane protein
MKSRGRTTFCFVAVLLGGCTAVGPDYERPAVDLPQKFPGPELEASAGVSPEWWTLYRDRTLEDLVQSARERNAEARLAAARVQEAEALAREAGAVFYPEVNAGASATRSRVSSRIIPAPQPGVALERSQYQLSASTSFELDFWGRFARANEAAQALLLSSRLSQDTVALTLAGATAQTYFALRSLDAQIAVLDNTVRVRTDSLDIVRSRAQAGLTSDLDVYQAEGALSDALVERADALRQRALVERQLGVLTGRLDLGISPGELFALPLPPTPPAGLPSDLLERRPDIRAAEQSLVAANAQIGVARAALFPAIALTASLGAQSAELSNLLSSGSGIWSLGFALAQPIFDAGRREARVDQARARHEQVLANYQRSVETAFREVADAIVNVAESARNEEQLRVRLDAARKALELSTLRYESGYSPYIEVLDAQRTANLAELVFVRNRQARLAFSVDLMRALGGGWK